MYPEHSVDELRFLRDTATLRQDFAECTRLTNALSERGAFDQDATGSQLLQASRERRITPAEAARKAQQFGKDQWAASRDGRLV